MTETSRPVDAGEAQHLERCLTLARQALGQTNPNPMVGAVLVKDGRVVAEAYHHRAGQPHAERLALQLAAGQARGAVLYTNMEPCCHHGRTPPCVEAIIEAGVARVVASLRDPDARVDGKGFERLRAAGIEVDAGGLAAAAAELNEGYLQVKRSGRPFVTAKAALSLDGRMATHTGSSQWITGPEARGMAHQLRAQTDAVIVGVGTVLTDDPRLTARDVDGSGPRIRAVLDSHARTPTSARFLAQSQGSALIVTTEQAPAARAQALRDAGARLLTVASDPTGRVSLPAALEALVGLDVNRALIEGGSGLLTTSFDLGMIDKVVLFYAPLLIGGADALPLWGGEGCSDLEDAPRIERVRHYRVGSDWAIEGYLRPLVAEA